MHGDKTFMMFFILSYFRIYYKKSHRKRKTQDDLGWGKKKTKRKSKDAESLFCTVYSPTASIMVFLPVWRMEGIHLRKKWRVYVKLEMLGFLNMQRSTKRMRDVCEFDT